ncbi:DUF4139 domain-containing protein [Aspergillus chevalieri]|uniref:DUF4139 domain-containing protein n=1 Tax=Aspergillus chevalieri TaxID=182096 RepID=A0A7R7ZRV9_ASPCH|nr:uncharacterized protein ACHE_80138A [Aspergillus chevalieri]BCR92238.1 hypothetical protein ACHE_80138A [Aspergillus chevalieri]
MADIATSEIQIYDLPTKTVNLTPMGATVVREITTKIQPFRQSGLNEITILGLDPKVDVDSIRIEGSGPATVTDIQTEVVPRRLLFEDVYGESDNDDPSDSEDPKLKSIRDERTSAEERLDKARNDENMAVRVLSLMDSYGNRMQPQYTESDKFQDFLERYVERYTIESERHRKAKAQVLKEEKEIVGPISDKLLKLEIQHQRRRDKNQREREQGKSQEMRKRQEQRHFWTYSVGQVVVHLDSQSPFTPGSSRRSSFSVVEQAADSPADSSEREVTLRLSYVVPGAKWSSRYEMSINTPSSTARVTYGAEFQNRSSETWSDTRVTLSTSQTAFSGLHETIPSLQVWHVKLINQDDSNEQPSWEKIVCNVSEGGRPTVDPRTAKQDYQMQLQIMEQQNRYRFQIARHDQDTLAREAPQTPPPPPQQPQVGETSLFGTAAPRPFGGNVPNPFSSPGTGSLLGGTAPQATPEGQADQFVSRMQAQSAPINMMQQAMQQAAPMAASAPPPPQKLAAHSYENNDGNDTNDENNEENYDDGIPEPPNFEYQDSTRQEYGLTTTYDLPGRRTLTPSSVNRRHALAKLDLKSITLQHVIVPKHRAAAFFRARIRNTSSIQILRGKVGMTVDNAFLGTTTMPNCAPNDFFDISLGVDPSILVTYAKPTVRRETSGSFFGKEDTAIFRRSCWVKNTKTTPANIIVLDQVPMSNDEKLQMNISEPKGLAREGDKVAIAVEETKGKGDAFLGKDGEIKWVMQLEPGKDVRLVLEYEMKAPRGNDVSVS